MLESQLFEMRLDYLSCILTVVSTALIGRRMWQGLILASVNSAIVCVIGFKTTQFGLIPANLFCVAMNGYNVFTWRSAMKPAEARDTASQGEDRPRSPRIA